MGIIDELLIQKYIKNGDIILDAGAYTGDTAKLFLENGATSVYAFEPVVKHYNILKNVPNVFAYNVGLYNKVGQQKLYQSALHDYGSTITNNIVEMFPNVFIGAEEYIIETVTIDSLNLPYINFWKIDVEGVEQEVCVGAQHVLETNPPRTIILESYSQFSDSTIRELLKYYYVCGRAIVLQDKTLSIIPTLSHVPQDVIPTPPTYIFTTDRL